MSRSQLAHTSAPLATNLSLPTLSGLITWENWSQNLPKPLSSDRSLVKDTGMEGAEGLVWTGRDGTERPCPLRHQGALPPPAPRCALHPGSPPGLGAGRVGFSTRARWLGRLRSVPRSPPSATGRAGPRPGPSMVRVLFLGTSPIPKLSLGSTLSHLFGITRTLLSGNSKGFWSTVPGVRDEEQRYLKNFFFF